MSVKQISVFLETTTDGLMEFTKVLQENNIDIRAFSIAEAPDFSIARVIVDDFERTNNALKNAGYVISVSTVLAVALPDRAGGLYEVLNSFTAAGVNVKYTYAFTGRQKGLAYRAFRVDDEANAIA
ncbi:MAG: acetolactate synthase, partial [Peptococcaceae bacterium]